MSEHNAYREQRKSSMYWVRVATEEFEYTMECDDQVPVLPGKEISG